MADLSAYDPAINAAAAEWGHDPDMLRALILQESSGNPAATSKAGAYGLTGILPKTATGLGITDPKDPTQQIFGAAKYLAEGRDKEGSPEGALLYYHGGPDWRKAYGPESAGYVPSVASKYTALKGGTKDSDDAVPSDAEFLKQTAPAEVKADAVPSDAEFLKQTGAAPGKSTADAAKPEATAPDLTADMKPGPPGDTSAGVDIYGRPNDSVVTAPSRVMGAIGRGAAEGFGSEPLTGHTILSPEAQAWMDARQREGGFGGFMAGLGSTVAGDIGNGGNLLLRGGNALFRGAQAGVMQGGAEAGDPQLGRDLAAMPEAFMGMPGGLGGPRSTAEVLPGRAAMERNRLVEPGAIERPYPGPPPAADVPVPKTAAEAKSIASAYYDKAERDGGTLTPAFANKFVEAANRLAPQSEAGLAVAGETPITALAGRLEALRDQPISLRGAQEIDEALSGLIDKEFGVKGLSKDGKALMDLQSDFREMIRNAGPDDVSGGTSGFDALVQGRRAWAQAMKMDDLERIQQRAEGTDNPATGIKSGIRVLLANRSRVRGYSPEEITALKQAQERGVTGGLLHVFGSRLIPQAAAVGGFFGSGPVAAAVAGTASHFVASGLRSGATKLQANRLANAVQTLGKGVPPNPNRLIAPPD